MYWNYHDNVFLCFLLRINTLSCLRFSGTRIQKNIEGCILFAFSTATMLLAFYAGNALYGIFIMVYIYKKLTCQNVDSCSWGCNETFHKIWHNWFWKSHFGCFPTHYIFDKTINYSVLRGRILKNLPNFADENCCFIFNS